MTLRRLEVRNNIESGVNLINAWWNGDSEQKYWIEFAQDREIGGQLRAPLGDKPKDTLWHWQLAQFVRPGDIVFHWKASKGAKIRYLAGWSTVEGPLRIDMFDYAKTRGKKGYSERNGSYMPLGPTHLLDQPITLQQVRTIENSIHEIHDKLKSRHGTIYFPFQLRTDGVRGAQGYLAKFPAELIEPFQRLGNLELESDQTAGLPPALNGPPSNPNTRQGFIQNTKKRIAIEKHAVSRAIEHYKGLGATQIEELGKPFDLSLRLNRKIRHIEVKGSGNRVDKVMLTKNEVSHTKNCTTLINGPCDEVDLVVVDDIECSGDGQVPSGSGRLRVWTDWQTPDSSLEPLTYSHQLPTGGQPY